MAESLSYVEIAYKILSEDPKHSKLHYRDIAKRAFDLELLESDNILIAGNLSSALGSEIRKATSAGTEPKFIAYGKGIYGLTENEPKGIFADIRQKNAEVKKGLLEALHAMHPTKFEELIGEVLRKLNFEEVEVTRQSGDGGIDVNGRLVVAGVIRSSVSVQVKRWRNNVQRGSISELRGSLRPHQTGLFVTTSDFSRQAIEEAEDPYKAPISLMNGNELVDLLCEFSIGVISERVTIYEVDKDEMAFDFPNETAVDEKGIEIFVNYKNHKHFAVFFSPTKIVYEGAVFKSPSAAGTKVHNGLPVNGWKFWKFTDHKTGKVHPLERLRNK